MGRYSYSNRIEADYLIKIHIGFLKKHGYLRYDRWREGEICWTNNFTGKKTSLTFLASTYINNDFFLPEQLSVDGRIVNNDFPRFNLTKTPCNFGGDRYWFECSFVKNGYVCERRVGTLYLKYSKLACRHCHNLTYNSRKLSGFAKAVGQIIPGKAVDDARDAVKRMYYDGKPTRKFVAYLRKKQKFKRIMFGHAQIMEEILRKKNDHQMRHLDENTKREIKKKFNLR